MFVNATILCERMVDEVLELGSMRPPHRYFQRDELEVQVDSSLAYEALAASIDQHKQALLKTMDSKLAKNEVTGISDQLSI
jgi:hypothetical protein